MFVRLLPLIAAFAPIVAANLAFLIGVVYESLPACIPYIDGCASISATGRRPPGSFLFRAVHLPYTTVLAATWYFAWVWLRALAPGRHAKKGIAMLVLGLISAFALIVYVTFLGTTEAVYEFMRRGGIYIYFAGASFAQILMTAALWSHARETADGRLRTYALSMLALCALPFVLGLLNLVLKAVLEKAVSDIYENSIEWTAALLMHAWYVVLYLAWRYTRFDVSVTVNSSARC